MNKKGTNAWIMNYKSTTQTQRRFSCYYKFHAKERSSDRSPVWRSLSIFCVKLRVIEETSLCLCGVFALGTCSHRALFLERWTHIFIWLIMNYMYLTWMSFFSPLPLFSLTFAIKQIIKKKIQAKSGLWMFNYWEKIHANFNIILSFPELSG